MDSNYCLHLGTHIDDTSATVGSNEHEHHPVAENMNNDSVYPIGHNIAQI